MEGANRAGTETTELGGIRCREPLNGGKALFSGDGIGEDGYWCTEGMLGSEEEAMALVGWIGREQEVTAGGELDEGGKGTTPARNGAEGVEDE